ncbi:MAG: transposase [Desulfobacterales bacterium]|nr:transposase [Desulfobacterales bacterium]
MATKEKEAQQRLTEFSEKRDLQYPTISKSWQTNWNRVIPFFAYLEEIRKIIYTTNAIESLNNICFSLVELLHNLTKKKQMSRFHKLSQTVWH